jgi:hypothetical protein
MMSAHWIHNTLRNKLRATFFIKTFRNIFPRKNPETICFVAATRLSEAEFWQESPLGIGLKPLLDGTTIFAKINFNNTTGLPSIYNHALKTERDAGILVFLHDDIWLEDINFIEKIRASLQRFDIVGVAGNTRISKYQPAWLFRTVENNKFVWDYGHLSGSVRHGTPGHSEPSVYGPTPVNCELLDGVFLAAKRNILVRSNVLFDESFKFHFYDMDFCRTARRSGLSLGTWPMDIIHISAGAFGAPSWLEGHSIYMGKWKT